MAHKNTIYYFYCYAEGIDLDGRNMICRALEDAKFSELDCTGGQAAFEPHGDFEEFKKIAVATAKKNGINLRTVLHCKDPGLGLFDSPLLLPQNIE